MLPEAQHGFAVLLPAGNLATTQAVRAQVRRDPEDDAGRSLGTVRSMGAIADYIGAISVEGRRCHTGGPEAE